MYAMKLHALSWLENQFIEPYSITVYLIIKWQGCRNEKKYWGEQWHPLCESAHSDLIEIKLSSKNWLGPSPQASIRSDGPVIYFFFKVLCTACETPCCLKPLLTVEALRSLHLLHVRVPTLLFKCNKSNNFNRGFSIITIFLIHKSIPHMETQKFS